MGANNCIFRNVVKSTGDLHTDVLNDAVKRFQTNHSHTGVYVAYMTTKTNAPSDALTKNNKYIVLFFFFTIDYNYFVSVASGCTN